MSLGPETPPNHHEDAYQPMALVGVTLIALVGFAMFFLSFLVAPLAILMIFYVGFAASDRARRNGTAARLEQESAARQATMERADEDQRSTPPAALGR